MFKPDMKYVNANNEVFVFGDSTGVYLDESELFDYEWEAEIEQGRVASVLRGVETKKVKLLFLNDRDPAQINRFLDVIDYDARTAQAGTLHLDGYQRRCLFTKCEAESYFWKPGLMYRNMTAAFVDTDWTKRTMETFEVTSYPSAGEFLDHPYDYEYDFMPQLAGSETVHNDSNVPRDFLLRFYGPCLNPYVVIGGNVYRVDCDVPAGARIEIDSMDRSAVWLTLVDGTKTDMFDAAKIGVKGSGQYLYELIPSGVSELSWPNTFRFDLEQVERRSEPKRTVDSWT